jgi:hypothetical protein
MDLQAANINKRTPEEDNKLLLEYRKYGHKWKKIASLLPGKKDDQCRYRWDSMWVHN